MYFQYLELSFVYIQTMSHKNHTNTNKTHEIHTFDGVFWHRIAGDMTRNKPIWAHSVMINQNIDAFSVPENSPKAFDFQFQNPMIWTLKRRSLRHPVEIYQSSDAKVVYAHENMLSLK